MATPHSFRPARALTHPLWWFCLATLALNDHVLKHSAWAGWVTGKLSDVAGLIVAPVLLAAVLNVRSPRGLWTVAGVIAAVFSVINLSAPAASVFDHAVSILVPFHTTTDPTDLWTLLAMPLGLLAMWRRMQQGDLPRRHVQWAAVALGGAACMATSPEPSCDDCIEPDWTPRLSSRISILNRSNELHVLRLRQLNPWISLDCNVVSQNPPAFLTRAHFGATTRWLVQSGQEIPLDVNIWEDQGMCSAALIESDTVPDIVVFWTQDAPIKTYQFDADIPVELPPDLNTLTIEAEYGDERLHVWRERSMCGSILDWCDEADFAHLADIPAGARYTWGARAEKRLFWPLPVLDTPVPTPTQACQVPGPGEALFWDALQGMHVIVAASFSADGCVDFTLEGGGHWYACGPTETLLALDPKDGPITADFSSVTSSGSGFTGGVSSMEVTVLDGPDAISRRVLMSRGYGLPTEVAYRLEAEVRTDCEPSLDYCDTPVIPADITLRGLALRPGEPTEIDTGVRATLVRAYNVPVRDAQCDALSGLLPQLDIDEESVYLEMTAVLE